MVGELRVESAEHTLVLHVGSPDPAVGWASFQTYEADGQGTVHIVWVQPPNPDSPNDVFYVYRRSTDPAFTPVPPLNASSTTPNSPHSAGR